MAKSRMYSYSWRIMVKEDAFHNRNENNYVEEDLAIKTILNKI